MEKQPLLQNCRRPFSLFAEHLVNLECWLTVSRRFRGFVHYITSYEDLIIEEERAEQEA